MLRKMKEENKRNRWTDEEQFANEVCTEWAIKMNIKKRKKYGKVNASKQKKNWKWNEIVQLHEPIICTFSILNSNTPYVDSILAST